MNRKNKDVEFKELEKMAHDLSDVRPMSQNMRKKWIAAQRTGKRGRPRKDPSLKSRIVPVSIEPSLLAAVDRYAKRQGLTRSRLVAEGLRMRIRSR
jgi:hypothetical protein